MPAIATTLKTYDRLVCGLGYLDAVPLLIARIFIGWAFIPGGWAKLHNLPFFIDRFREWGIPAPEIQAPFAASCELLFGSAVLIGLFTRLSAIPLIVIMIVAIVKVQWANLSAPYHLDLLDLSEAMYIGFLLWLVVRGAGFLSVDRALLKLRPGPAPKE